MPSRGGIDDWVEQAGLGLIPNLSQQLTSYAGNLEQLRSMSQDDIEAALLPLKLRGITAAKVKSALEALRNPDDASSIHRGLGVSVEGGGSAAAATMAELQKAGVAPPPVQTSPPPKPLRGTKEANKEEVADLMTMLSPRGGQQLSERQRSHSNVPSPELQAAIAAQERMAAEAAVAEAEAEAARAEAQAAEAEAEAAEAAVAAASGRGEEDIDEDAETLAAIAAVAAFEASETAARDLSKQGGGSTKLPLTLNLPKELTSGPPPRGLNASDDDMPVFTPRGTMLLRPAAQSSADDMPIFTPRTSAIMNTDAEVAAQAAALASMMEGDGDVPIFTPRTMAVARMLMDDSDPNPAGGLIFTPRASAEPPSAAGGLIFTPRDWRDDEQEMESLFTPRSRDRVLSATGIGDDDEDEFVGLDGAGFDEGAASASSPEKSPEPKAEGKKAKAKGGGTDRKAKGDESRRSSDSGDGGTPTGKKPAAKSKGKKTASAKAAGAKKEHPFIIDIQTAEGEIVSSMSTELKVKTLATTPMYSGLVMPALESYSKLAGLTEGLANKKIRVSVDGTLLTNADAKIADLIKPDAPGYQFTRILIALPLGRDAAPVTTKFDASAADSAPFHVDIVQADGEKLTSLECSLQKALFQKPLLQAVGAPALRSYWKLNPDGPRVAYETVKIAVDGQATDGSAAAVSYVKAANTAVVVTLTIPAGQVASPDKKSKKAKKPGKAPPPSWVIDLQTSEGDTMSSLGTVLNSALLGRTVQKALVVPALNEYARLHGIKLDPQIIRVIVNGRTLEVGSKDKCKDFVTPGGEVISVVLLMPEGLAVPKQQYLPSKDANFHVDVVAESGERFEFEVNLNEKWLAKSVKQSLVVPALKTINQGGVDPSRVQVKIGGKQVANPATEQCKTFASKDNRPVAVEMHIPVYDAVANHNPTLLDRVARAAGAVAERPPARFQVNILGGTRHWEADTELNAKWLRKSLREGLVAPALQAYFSEDAGVEPIAANDAALVVEINGKASDCSQPGEHYVNRATDELRPTKVDIRLPHMAPQYALTKITRAA